MPAQTAENRLHSILAAGTYAIITMASESGHSLLTIETPVASCAARGRGETAIKEIVVVGHRHGSRKRSETISSCYPENAPRHFPTTFRTAPSLKRRNCTSALRRACARRIRNKPGAGPKVPGTPRRDFTASDFANGRQRPHSMSAG